MVRRFSQHASLALGVVASACAGQTSIGGSATPVGGGGLPSPLARAPKTFWFDNGFHATGPGGAGPSFVFERESISVDPSGTLVGANEPRYERERLLAGATVEELVRATAWNTKILASGVDADGSTPMMVLWEASANHLDVFHVAGDALLAAEAGGPGRVRTVCNGLGDFPDIFGGAYANRAYSPEAGVVCHGLIVLMCAVSAHDAGTWTEESIAFVVSQDRGATWALAYEDASAQPGVDRAREWAMQNYWTFQRDEPPTEAYFVSADYRSKPDTTGGRVIMMRARRPGPGIAWTLEPGATVYSTDGPAGQHVHTAGIAPFGANGLRLVVGVGDAASNNRIVSLTRADDAYAEAGGWTIDESYHGWAGDPGSNGNQFIGCAPASSPLEVLVGSDLTGEQVMRLDTASGGGGGDHPAHQGVFGWGMSEGILCQNFVIRTPTPELSGPYVAKFEPQVSGISAPATFRALYSPDGERWAYVYPPAGKAGWSLALHGPHVYFDGSAGITDVRRVRVPALKAARPLAIGPGTTQRLRASPTLATQANGTVAALSRNADGLWTDAGVVLDPQPPSLGQVYRVETSEGDAGVQVVDLVPLAGEKDFGHALGSGYFSIRFWVMNASNAMGARPIFQLRSDASNLGFDRTAAATIGDLWQPVTMQGLVAPLVDQNLKVRIKSAQAAAVTQSFYVALESVGEGVDAPGYPAPAAVGAGGERRADEIGRIEDFQCGQRWTITLALETPPDSWDRWSQGTLTRQHVATIAGEAGDAIHLFADLFQDRLVMYVYEDGAYVGAMRGPSMFWHRGSPVLVSIAQSGAGLEATMSSGCAPAAEGEPYTPGPILVDIRPRAILMGDPTGESGDGFVSRVSPMLWWGGRIDERRALTASERAGLLADLSFLPSSERDGSDGAMGRASVPGDLDGDGDVDAFDVVAWDDHRRRGDARADVNADGRIDHADLARLVESATRR